VTGHSGDGHAGGGNASGAHAGAHSGTPGGPRGGARRAAKPKRSLQPRLLLLGLGALAALGAWGFLVWAAIDFGRSARGGDSSRWAYLAVASVGAVVCLFLSLLLVTVLLRRVGILEESERTRSRRADKVPHRH
jgi:hypothetical protein